jgi:hypothetical protein
MAIDRIPGVGPQNTDIATAVAAAVPTIGTITSAITSNAASSGVTIAAITSAGNSAGWGATGPTTSAIAAAVPNLTQITSAITTNAASAGVTNASIATQVANNAPSPNGWTLIGSTAWSSGAVTFSSLSGYKSYRMLVPYSFVGSGQGGAQMGIRINADSASSYMTETVVFKPSSITTSVGTPNQAMYVSQDNLSNGTTGFTQGVIEVYNANVAGPKYASWNLVLRTSDGATIAQGIGTYNTTSTINSITYFIVNGAIMNTNSMNIYLYGAN